MVQYKRKPVKFVPLPPFLDDSSEVWVIESTGEIFLDYDAYLTRRDFYMQKIFTCEATGHTGYNFFEAQESEMEASKEINSIFPEGLRSRVLTFVQFRTTARMDDLVNVVFDHFREHYTVGDRVSVEHENVRRFGVIAQMQDTSMLRSFISGQPSDTDFRSFTYHIHLEDNSEQVTKYKASELQRDRRVYSKLILKQFLRGAITREAWNGAPWTVKDHLAKRYNISTKAPEAKTRDAILAAKKATNSANLQHTIPGVNAPSFQNGQNGTAFGMNGSGPGDLQQSQLGLGPGQATFVNFSANPPPYWRRPGLPPPFNHPDHPDPWEFPWPQRAQGQHPPHPPLVDRPPHLPIVPGANLPSHLAQIAQNMPPPGSGLPISLPFQNNFMQYQALAPTTLPQQLAAPFTKPFEPIKYPIEDLRIKQPRVSVQRPPLKFLSDDVPDGAESPEKEMGILMKSVGPLLCAWETLNVHDTIYALDSFTLDDFVDAMRFTSEDVECELLVEVHCAVLKQLVNESGKLEAPLPTVEESDESDDEESSKTASPEPEPEPPMRTTRSSLRKSGASIIAKQRTPTPEPPKQLHRASEFVAEYDWIEQCKIRNFRDGGWQAMLVAVLYALSFSIHKEACEEILAELVPSDEDPSLENIANNYVDLDVNLRIAALEMVLQLTVATEVFRDQLIAASQEMTRLRKEKIEFQKKRKELADELFRLDMERKIQLPMNMPASPTEVKDMHDISMTGTDDVREDTDVVSESSEEPKARNRKLRHTKQNKRKREAEAVKKEKAKKAKAEAAKTKQQQEWEKLLAAIESKKLELKDCEANINELDDDLRETLVHRSKLIGKDRFLNKYYWFEHNGMPFGGVPNSSTADYGYANGRLWVQGPDEYELQPNLEEPALSQDLQEFGFTIPQRKDKEEGLTHLSNSTEWGYYDDPSDIDKLIAWLDERGVREKALRKELQAFRDRIAEYMIKMKEHLSESEKTKTESEEITTRVSTRTKTHIENDNAKDRCLLWTNSIMRDELGYNHSEEYEPPKKTKRGTAKVTKAKGKR